jgi:hypothetical protein
MRLTLPLLLLITACGDKDADSGAPTGDCPAMGVRGQVTDEAGSPGPSPSARVRVWAASDLDSAPIEALADTDGVYSVDPGPGRWVLLAEGTNGCITEDAVTVEIGPCGADGVDLVLAMCPG